MNPFHPQPAAARGLRALTLTRAYLLTLLRRTPGRRARWQCQAQRRRPWLARPLTAGEQSLLDYRLVAQELASQLEPFRRTRVRGHEELNALLLDTDTRPVVVAQVRALRASLDRAGLAFGQQQTHITRWRTQWAKATSAQKQRLIQEEKAVAISSYHDGLHLLMTEARADVSTIEALCPAAFMPVPAPEPWLDTSTTKPGPTPYSA